MFLSSGLGNGYKRGGELYKRVGITPMPPLDEVRTNIPVKDIMTMPVVTVSEDDTAETVAKLMRERDLGSIIVADGQGHPVGIITERDIVARVTARDLLPSKVKAREVMSGPVKSISPEADIKVAAEEMHRHGIRRLAVMEGGKMIGIISSKDIVSITPALIEIISERARIRSTPLLPPGAEAAGAARRGARGASTGGAGYGSATGATRV